MTSSHHSGYSVLDEDANPRCEDSANMDSTDCTSLGNSSNEHAKCSNKEEKVITEALRNLIKDLSFDDRLDDFGSKGREAMGNFPKSALLSLEDTSNPFPLDEIISCDNHEEERIEPGLHAATSISAANTWGTGKILDIPTLQSFHNQSIMKDASLDLPNHLLHEITSCVPSLKETSTSFQHFNANKLSAKAKVKSALHSFQKQKINKHENSQRTVPDMQGKQYGKRGEFKRTNRGGNRYNKGKKSDYVDSQKIVRNGLSAVSGSLKTNSSNGETLKKPLAMHSSGNVLSDGHLNKIVGLSSGSLCSFGTNGHLPKHTGKKMSHSPLENVESPKLINEIKHSEGYSNMLQRENDNAESFLKVPFSNRSCDNVRNATVGNCFMQHPYRGGYYDMGTAGEEFPSGGGIVTQHMAKQQDKTCFESTGNTGNQNTNVNNLTGSQNTPPLLHTGSIKNDESILVNFSETVAGPPWVSLCDLSMLLSTIINIYLQAFEMGSGATKDVCSMLNAVIGLVEETVKGMQIYDRMSQSAVVQTTSDLVGDSFKTLEKVRNIILLQRKNVKQAIDVTQTELKSTDPHASYSVEEISDICDRTKRMVVEQTEKVKWLNNDLKFDHYFLKLTVNPSCKEREELTDVLFKDIEKAKQYLESPAENSDSRSNSLSEPLGSGMYYMQLMKQCFIIKQSLEKLQYEYA